MLALFFVVGHATQNLFSRRTCNLVLSLCSSTKFMKLERHRHNQHTVRFSKYIFVISVGLLCVLCYNSVTSTNKNDNSLKVNINVVQGVESANNRRPSKENA